MITLVQGASRGLGLEFVRQCLHRGETVVATCRRPEAARQLQALASSQLTILELDLLDEGSIEDAAQAVRRLHPRLHRIFNVAGVLHGDAFGPERRISEIDPEALHRVFAVNAFGPLLVAKHFAEMLRHDEPAVFASLSARVGSIEDNRKGGWYAYRGSKAAQNMFTKNLAIELGRRAKHLAVVALHPGTVATELSAPFTDRLDPERVFDVERAVEQLLKIADGLTPADTGRFFAWDGTAIPW